MFCRFELFLLAFLPSSFLLGEICSVLGSRLRYCLSSYHLIGWILLSSSKKSEAIGALETKYTAVECCGGRGLGLLRAICFVCWFAMEAIEIAWSLFLIEMLIQRQFLVVLWLSGRTMLKIPSIPSPKLRRIANPNAWNSFSNTRWGICHLTRRERLVGSPLGSLWGSEKHPYSECLGCNGIFMNFWLELQ